MDSKKLKQVTRGYKIRRLKRNWLVVGRFVLEFSVMVALIGLGVLYLVAFGS